MVKTRSQEAAPLQTVFTEPPRSPSGAASQGAARSGGGLVEASVYPLDRPVAPPAGTTDARRDFATAPGAGGGPAAGASFHPPAPLARTAHLETPRRPSPTRSRASRRSTSSAAARIRNVHLEAEERLAEIRKKELAIDRELIEQRRATEIENIREEEADDGSGIADVNERVDDWLRQNVATPLEQRGESTTLGNSAPVNEDGAGPTHTLRTPRTKRGERGEHYDRVHFEATDAHRPRSPTPTRHRRGIEQLAEAFERMTRVRPAPRQATELPIFSGAISEWLSFKAAMTESTATYDFTPTENMARLRNCLRGEAREAVAGLLCTASSPEQVMRTLEQCFGRPEFIVDKTMEELRRLPRLGSTANELNAFAVKLQNIVCMLQNVDRQDYLRYPLLAREVLEKLSPYLRARWCDFAKHHLRSHEPQLVLLSRFLMDEADLALQFTYAAPPTPAPRAARPAATAAPPPVKKRANVYATTADTPPPPPPVKTEAAAPPARKYECAACGENHTLPNCKRFKEANVDERWKIVKDNGTCFKCLESRHRRLRCRRGACGLNGCRRPHHRLLHSDPAGMDITTETRSAGAAAAAAAADDPATAAADETVSVATTASEDRSTVLLKVVPIAVRGPRGEADTYALLDEGSTVSLIEEGLSRKLGLEGPARPLHIRGVASSSRETTSRLVKAIVRGKGGTDAHEVKLRTIQQLVLHRQAVPAAVLRHPHLRDLDEADVCYGTARPQLLVGADNWHLIVSRQMKMGRRDEPAASLTALGWAVHGTVPRALHARNTESILHVFTPDRGDTGEERLEKLIEEHFKIDALGVSLAEKVTDADRRAVEIFNNTARRVDGRFEVALLWRTDDVTTPPSYSAALRRLRAVERRFEREPEFASRYKQEVEALLEKGYAKLCDGTEERSTRKWYLPHFPVINPNKPGKLRLVFDAAAKSHGVCLNDLLLEGPDLLRSLQGIMFRFREGPVAVTADIQEMFLRIAVREEDQPAQMFLWREDPDQPPRKYKMTAMIFGASSSPFLAHSVRDRNARDFAVTHPAAANSITRNHYMDDFVESFNDTATAKQVISEVIFVHAQAGFKLRGWNSNQREILEDIEEGLRARSPTDLAPAPDKTLGLLWDAERDQLAFKTTLHRVPEEVIQQRRTPTKREALCAVMSLYDPLGLLSQFTIRAKIMLQGLWRQKLGWDEPLPEAEADDFARWLGALQNNIAQLSLPRWYGAAARRELHIFCDASEQAYAAAAYWRMQRDDGTINVTLAAAKAKVAPIKAQSIPRLELQAAVIGARLAEAISTEHECIPERTIYWTDSRTVLHWIRRDARRYTPFVAHRLGELAERTAPEEWRWVPTEYNVADDATRSSRRPIAADDRWFNGPAFLHQPERAWPTEEAAEEEDDSEVVGHTTTQPEPCLPDAERFSSYERLIRATAHVLLFIDRCRGRATKLQVHHLEKAEKLCIQRAQMDSFSTEVKALQEGRHISKSSRVYKLDPVLKDGVLRLNGRIGAATVPSETKQPAILDGRHPFTRLLVLREHRKTHHGNREAVVNNLRQRYWILRLRATVRAVASECGLCKLRRLKPRTPIFGDLPRARVDAFHRPFTYCGVDYFGPLMVKIGRRHEKRWGALFTCMTTRAVHIELVSSLSTDSALMALRRMAARRGWPKEMMSDNGTNFRGADAELRAAYAEWAPALEELGQQHRMTWRFIPPGAPNMGGAWERLVRSVKTALAVVLREKTPPEEVLATLLAEAEHTINARPLTHVSVDPHDPEALTPNHFLLGSSTGLPHTGPCSPADRRVWRASQALADEFWRRWVREYLPTLAPRHAAAATGEKQLQPGDLVIIADPALPRNVWPRGEVITVYPGPDGRVRCVDVRTKGGVLRRPTTKLAVLTKKEGCDESTPGGEM